LNEKNDGRISSRNAVVGMQHWQLLAIVGIHCHEPWQIAITTGLQSNNKLRRRGYHRFVRRLDNSPPLGFQPAAYASITLSRYWYHEANRTLCRGRYSASVFALLYPANRRTMLVKHQYKHNCIKHFFFSSAIN
jgi:hypothetical protein